MGFYSILCAHIFMFLDKVYKNICTKIKRPKNSKGTEITLAAMFRSVTGHPTTNEIIIYTILQMKAVACQKFFHKYLKFIFLPWGCVRECNILYVYAGHIDGEIFSSAGLCNVCQHKIKQVNNWNPVQFSIKLWVVTLSTLRNRICSDIDICW